MTLLQLSPDELEFDAAHLFAIVMCDAEFHGVMEGLSHHEATDGVYEAITKVLTAPEPATEEEKLEFLDLSTTVHIRTLHIP